MSDAVTCQECGQDTDPLATFPGGICLDCYKQTAEANRPVGASELRRMWGGTR